MIRFIDLFKTTFQNLHLFSFLLAIATCFFHFPFVPFPFHHPLDYHFFFLHSMHKLVVGIYVNEKYWEIGMEYLRHYVTAFFITLSVHRYSETSLMWTAKDLGFMFVIRRISVKKESPKFSNFLFVPKNSRVIYSMILFMGQPNG